MNPQQDDSREEFEPGVENPHRFEPKYAKSGIGQFSKVLIVVGAIMTTIGVIGGFSAMFLMKDGSHSVFLDLLMLAPLGFLMAFTGITGWVISGGK
ncbi:MULTISPECIES: hypothetical protein [unclassified Halothiobacillus]|jgi:hypothetical protein|uniref:hypothetical protein n=1 Tax=unclassified Halothiobacillus TaxID=2636392 RepID=UPI000BD6563A|nr:MULTISPECIES: hypothetical protein [unclassified Halothiobacillus]OZB57161.1 MAG: hypothetical protein B7X35_02450 [Halothiobacillus sp. 14-56-357]OZB79593.1 MAG: hypothetical protein B7X29_00020 [Halothiobacillus sp. 13-55-115]MDD3575653.1 hypothetical protein [Halothiobacillus sp.]MDD4965668.1 hypothetical protein [Halothiobacillus sp.]MDY0147142.1 hypothetical protein [Halothiobacillus sp.]